MIIETLILGGLGYGGYRIYKWSKNKKSNDILEPMSSIYKTKSAEMNTQTNYDRNHYYTRPHYQYPQYAPPEPPASRGIVEDIVTHTAAAALGALASRSDSGYSSPSRDDAGEAYTPPPSYGNDDGGRFGGGGADVSYSSSDSGGGWSSGGDSSSSDSSSSSSDD